jgi:hypothetical protein
MSVPAYRLRPVEQIAVEDDFWDHPRSSAEIRERLRTALLDDFGCFAAWRLLLERVELRQHVGAQDCRSARMTRSPSDVLFLVDELVAQVRREERAERDAP